MAFGDLEYRIRLDLQGFSSLSGPKPLHLVSNEKITLNIVVEQLQAGSLPPAYAAVNITGFTFQWVAKADIDDVDGLKKWDVAGSITDGPNGKAQFVVPKTSVNFTAELGYSEIVVKSGADPIVRVKLPFTLTKEGLTI